MIALGQLSMITKIITVCIHTRREGDERQVSEKESKNAEFSYIS